jgi:hypothetical protein
MLDPSAGGYCAVCAASIEETIAARLCGDDARAPRVALEPLPPAIHVARSGQRLELDAIAFDEGEISRYRFLVDGVAVAGSELPFADISLDTLAPGHHAITAQAIDAAGWIGESVARRVDVVRHVVLEASVVALSAIPGADGWVQVSATATPVGGTLSLGLGASQTVVPIVSGDPLVAWVPAGVTGQVALSAIAFTASGVASSPRVVHVDVPAATRPAPLVESVHVANIDLAALGAIGPQLDLDVTVRSCTPLARLDVSTLDGKVLASATVTPVHACLHSVRVAISSITGPIEIAVTDRGGRAGRREVVVPPLIDPVSACGIDPRIDDPVVGLARPASLALGQAGTTIVTAGAGVDGAAVVMLFATRPDGTRGGLVAARDFPGPPRDGVAGALRVTVVAACNAGLVAATSEVPVAVDAVAPRLRASRFMRAGESPAIAATDGSGAATIETVTDAASLVIRAIDATGNVAQRTITPVTFPHERAGCAP